MNDMNELHKMITQIHNMYFNYGIKTLSKGEQARLVISKINDMQKRLLAVWNIQDYSVNHMINIVEHFNNEIEYIRIYGGLSENEVKPMYILDRKAANKVEFIKTMLELHKMIYQKTITLPEYIRSSKGTLLMDLADNALYHVCETNFNFPTCKKIYDKRKEHLSTALMYLRSMNVPMLAIFNSVHYSNDTMLEISKLLNTEIKLLNGLRKSDNGRFSKLT